MCTIQARLTRPRLPRGNLRFVICNFACTFSSTTTTQVEEGDLLTLLNVYYAFHNRGGSDWSKSKHWCAAHFLRYKALKRFEFLFFCVCFLLVCFLFVCFFLSIISNNLNILSRATDLREQLFKVLKRFGMPIVSCTNKEAILKTITMGLFPNAAYLAPTGVYKTVRGDIPLKVHPKSVLYTVKMPPHVVYTEIVHSKDVYMRDITKIDPEWLQLLAPHFYEKRRLRREIIPNLF